MTVNGEYDCQNVRYNMITAILLVGLQNVSDRR
jgi:hypothetical protein